jgi:hypothetical protein
MAVASLSGKNRIQGIWVDSDSIFNNLQKVHQNYSEIVWALTISEG